MAAAVRKTQGSPGSAAARRRECDRAVEDYVRRRVAAQQLAPSSERQVRYLLGSWARTVDDWRHPSHDEIHDWCTVPASADGKHRRAACLRSFYGWYAVRRTVDPMVPAMVPTISGSKKRPKPVPDQVLAAAMDRASYRDRAAMILGRFAGLRAAEIAAVHTDDLSVDELYVVGKGGRERYVACHPLVIEVLAAVDDGWVFPSSVRPGEAVQPCTMSAWLSAALPPPWTAHTLRHAFATDLYERTRDLVLVSEQLGHASVKTTERYVKSTGDARAAVVGMGLAAA